MNLQKPGIAFSCFSSVTLPRSRNSRKCSHEEIFASIHSIFQRKPHYPISCLKETIPRKQNRHGQLFSRKSMFEPSLTRKMDGKLWGSREKFSASGGVLGFERFLLLSEVGLWERRELVYFGEMGFTLSLWKERDGRRGEAISSHANALFLQGRVPCAKIRMEHLRCELIRR